MIDFEPLISALGGLVPLGADEFLLVQETELSGVETLIGCSLPSDYAKFLRAYGACTFAEDVEVSSVTPLPTNLSGNSKVPVGSFYGAARGANANSHSLIRAIKAFRNRMPSSVMPIMSCSGNVICIGIQGKEKGKVYYWDHENEWDEDDYFEDYGKKMPAKLKFQNLHLIANSFEDFFKRLAVNESP